ncbi:hypothetical protein DPMN_015446 [Dreissena polymorpha]|uniref:Uncharacterized protein n=1 Tax=Dreissena polymorpha TaxID=45954 RepID=A0A9D4N962_DREPO|nr:hypothetical protein DPMN_015446 [Dreissena polymorpha]
MTGKNAGLAALLRREYGDHIINIHCFSNRLELAFHDVVKSENKYQKLMNLLIGLHKFYKIHKNRKGLKKASEALSINIVAPKKITTTRWLPYLNDGINSLAKNYKAYEAHLASCSHENAKAQGYYSMLLDKGLMTFAIVLQVLLCC